MNAPRMRHIRSAPPLSFTSSCRSESAVVQNLLTVRIYLLGERSSGRRSFGELQCRMPQVRRRSDQRCRHSRIHKPCGYRQNIQIRVDDSNVVPRALARSADCLTGILWWNLRCAVRHVGRHCGFACGRLRVARRPLAHSVRAAIHRLVRDDRSRQRHGLQSSKQEQQDRTCDAPNHGSLSCVLSRPLLHPIRARSHNPRTSRPEIPFAPPHGLVPIRPDLNEKLLR
jgi:hypothetical protein